MLETLGLDDDLDPVDVVVAIERAFDVTVSDDEAKSVFKVGELFDLLRKKIDAGDANRKCASAMAFYRLRRAMNDQWADVRCGPSHDLSSLDRIYTKSFVKSIEERSGLRLPRPDPGPIGKVARAVFLVSALGFMATFILALGWMFVSAEVGARLVVVSAVLLFGGLFGSYALMRMDAGRLPADCRTLGALAERTAELSYGRLVKQGADARDSSIWKAMVDVLSDVASVPADQIVRETYFLQSALKGAKASA